jgi:hypothetical protein
MLFNIVIETLGERLREDNISFRMYADDLIVIGDDATVSRAIGIVEMWAFLSNMQVNKSKSGVLPVAGSALRVGNQVDGYPVVDKYKYLGLLVNGRMDLKDHLASINKKAGFLAHKLYGLRCVDNLRLNVSLYTVFVQPLYRLATALYGRQDQATVDKIDAHMRVWCKKFARIPVNTANNTFLLVAGDIKGKAKAAYTKVKAKLKER